LLYVQELPIWQNPAVIGCGEAGIAYPSGLAPQAEGKDGQSKEANG
jgi:hypothetical protein